MLDKLKLNNHITSLKTDVQKAKVQVIQKLIRRIREIQKDAKAKGDPAKKETKITKLKDEICVLKVRYIFFWFILIRSRVSFSETAFPGTCQECVVTTKRSKGDSFGCKSENRRKVCGSNLRT